MYKIKVNGSDDYKLSEEKDQFRFDGKLLDLDVRELASGHLHLIYKHKSYQAEIVSQHLEDKTIVLKINGRLYQVAIEDQYDRLLKEMGFKVGAGRQAREVKAPMPGLVLNVSVSEGQEIKKGDSLLVLEAMKMENMLKATSDGFVKRVFASKGDKVEKGQVLVELTA